MFMHLAPWDFFEKLKDDEEISGWFEQARDWILEGMKKPDEVETEEMVEKVKEMIRSGRKVTENYREEIEKLYDAAVDIFEKIKDDPALKTFSDKLTQLGRNFALNYKGEPDPMVIQESFTQVTSLLVRLFNSYLTEFPIQQLEVHSPNYDVVLQDIKTEGTGFAPETIQVTTASRTIINLKNRDPSRSVFRIGLEVNKINPCFKDFKYFFTHNTFPSYSDVGRADLCFDEDGLSAKAVMTIRTVSGQPSRATLDKLWVNVDPLKLTIQETQHQILSALTGRVFAEVLRSKLETTIWSALRSRFEEIVSKVNAWFDSNPLQQTWTSVAAPNVELEPAQVAAEHARTKAQEQNLKAPVFPDVDALIPELGV